MNGSIELLPGVATLIVKKVLLLCRKENKVDLMDEEALIEFSRMTLYLLNHKELSDQEIIGAALFYCYIENAGRLQGHPVMALIKEQLIKSGITQYINL